MKRHLISLSAVIWIICLSAIGIYVDQSSFYLLTALYLFSFISYYLISLHGSNNRIGYRQMLFIAIFGRLALIPLLPNLSDDIYRFMWDGELVSQGVNPYQFTPAELPVKYHTSITPGLYGSLNSPDYYSIYPPICQLLFAAGAKLANGSILVFKIVLGSVFLGVDLAVISLLRWILDKINLAETNVFWYALNPLILIELHLNLHFEMIMIGFITFAVYFIGKGKNVWSSVCMGFAISTKLLPLIFLPFIQKYTGWKKGIVYGAVSIFTFVTSFLPFWNPDFLLHYLQSLNLYFRKFEYNASIYYLVRWIGYQIEGYNMIATIGPLLSVLGGAIIMGIWARQKVHIPMLKMLILCSVSITIYLFFTTTVHPWYLATPVFLLPFTRHTYVILWSGVIILSYAGYMFEPVKEQMWLLVLEYGLVMYMLLRAWGWGLKQNGGI